MPSSSRPDDPAELKRRAIEFARAGKTSEAAALLRSLIQSKIPVDPQLREWAAAQLQRIEPARKSVDVASLYAAADDLFRRYDFDQAASLLQSIPSAQHTVDSRQLLKTATSLRDEVAELVEDLQANLSTGHFDRLEADVERLLEICPVSATGKRLRTTLDTYRRIPRERRLYRVSDTGELLAANTAGGSRAFVVIAMLAVVVAAWGGWQQFRPRLVEVAVRFDQPPAAGGPLRIRIDGQTIDMTVDGANLSLPPGDYVYEIYDASTRLLGPVRISVQMGLPNVVTVAVADLRLDAQVADIGGMPALPGVPGIGGPQANDAARPGAGLPAPMVDPAEIPVVAAPPAGLNAPEPDASMPSDGTPPALEGDPAMADSKELAAAAPVPMTEVAPQWEPEIAEAMKPFKDLGCFFFRDNYFRSNAIYIRPSSSVENRKKTLEMLADAPWIEGLAWASGEVTAEEVALVRKSGIIRLRIEEKQVALLDNPKLRTVRVTLGRGTEAGALAPIGKLDELEELQISTGWGPINGGFLSQLKNPSRLKHYCLDMLNAERPHASAYLTSISKMTGLEVLRISLPWRKSAVPRHFSLPEIASLRRIELHYVNVVRPSYSVFARSPQLEVLRLSNVGLKEADMVHFTGLTGLKVLSIQSEDIGDEGLEPLGKIGNLTEVELWNLPIRGPGLRFLNSHQNLTPGKVTLKHLKLTDIELGIFAKLPQVTSVDVFSTRVTQGGIAQLIEIPHVQLVVCGDDQITAEEASALTKGTSKRIKIQPSFKGPIAAPSSPTKPAASGSPF